MSSEGLEQALADYRSHPDQEGLATVAATAGPLIGHFARLLGGGISRDDLVQAGYEGLLKAVDRFDPTKGSFVTYASHYILGEMRHQIRHERSFDRPAWVVELQGKVFEAMERILQETGEMPDSATIARAVNVREEGVQQALAASWLPLEQLDLSHVRSLRSETFRLPIEDRIVLEQALSHLNDLQRRVLHGVFYRGMSQREVADDLNINQRRVSRLLARGLARLKEFLSD